MLGFGLEDPRSSMSFDRSVFGYLFRVHFYIKVIKNFGGAHHMN
jgi:hypothetical protein